MMKKTFIATEDSGNFREVPVLFLTFNRPIETMRVFEEIKKFKPKKIFIASDGPRLHKIGEDALVMNLRNRLVQEVTWDCKLMTLFRDKNLGCKMAVSSAIDWFFDQVDEGIILEDDCLPSPSFFLFCGELLHKYRGNPKIFQISGTNVEGESPIQESYFFSSCFNAWGWATWRRAWRKYNVAMSSWPKYRFKIFSYLRGYPLFEKIKSAIIYEKTYRGKINTWDYQWIYSCIINRGLCIIPRVNLVENIGFSKDATHTVNKKDSYALARQSMGLPLRDSLVSERSDYKRAYYLFFKHKS